ncbi:zinc finger protein 512B isoform X2 [Tachysurus ichikawai]
MKNSSSSPVFLKIKKTEEMSQPSQNGERTDQRTEKTQESSSQQRQQKESLSDAGGRESTFPEEDPERMKHRRKQKTPKKFTGEQPSISGTFGLKGMNKVDEKLKVCRTKRLTPVPAKREWPCYRQAPPIDCEAQDAILENSEVSCSTCSAVINKTCPGFKKHLKICQKAPINEETELDSITEEEKEQPATDKAKPDPALMKINKRLEEKGQNKKNAIMEPEELLDLERTPSGRVRRRSAQVAVFHLQEIAEDELVKDWGAKRRIKDDLVPDIKRVRKEKAVSLYT